MFLFLYREIGMRMTVRGEDGALATLVHEEKFVEFTRLAATLELFLRCMSVARRFHKDTPHLPPEMLGSAIRRDLDVPSRIYESRKFGEIAKRAGEISVDDSGSKAVADRAMRSEPKVCYLCGIALNNKAGDRAQATADHIWPRFLGGETIETNILPACKDCNDKKHHSVTWAWGPVTSTHYTQAAPEDNPPGGLMLSLGFGRLMLAAARRGQSRLLTLKEAAKDVLPAIPKLDVSTTPPYLFFELYRQMEAQSA